MDELKDRLKKALSIRNIKAIELCEKTNIPKSAISQYLSGYAKPKSDRIYLISKVLNINETWLLGYDVPMEKQNTTTDELITMINSLDDAQQKNVIDYIQFLKSQQKKD